MLNLTKIKLVLLVSIVIINLIDAQSASTTRTNARHRHSRPLRVRYVFSIHQYWRARSFLNILRRQSLGEENVFARLTDYGVREWNRQNTGSPNYFMGFASLFTVEQSTSTTKLYRVQGRFRQTSCVKSSLNYLNRPIRETNRVCRQRSRRPDRVRDSIWARQTTSRMNRRNMRCFVSTFEVRAERRGRNVVYSGFRKLRDRRVSCRRRCRTIRCIRFRRLLRRMRSTTTTTTRKN